MTGPSIELIAALARNGVIGRKGQLPWHLPDDLKFFKQTTMGHPCLMGRRTYESVGKPLPGRRTIVVSSTFVAPSGVEVVRSLDDAQLLVANVSCPVFVVGGSVLYEAALAIANALVLTEIDQDFEGDTFFPKFDRSQWRLVSETPHAKDDRHAVSFRFCRYERAANA